MHMQTAPCQTKLPVGLTETKFFQSVFIITSILLSSRLLSRS